MKLLHLSDLHLGKRLNEFSLLDDQRDILEKVLAVIDAESPDAVLIAGDVYDKAVPSAEAVAVFDDFLVALAGRGAQVFVISGNHDSPERIAFGGRLMDASGIYLSPVYDGRVAPVTLFDDFGPVRFHMLPFVKPAHVRRFAGEEDAIDSYTDAIRWAVRQMDIDPKERNVLITHQFVTGAGRSESEELSVGGTDNVDAEVFCDFDYVALGHLHSPQNCGSQRIRYCGTPLPYSFSEARDVKSVTIVQLGPKGSLSLRTVPLTPLHPMTELRGSFRELSQRPENTAHADDYTHLILTDEEDVPDAIGRLRKIYPNLMKLDYDNTRTRTEQQVTGAELREDISPLELFAQLYEKQNNRPMSPEQAAFVERLLEKLREEAAE